jgi:hypothetical protein
MVSMEMVSVEMVSVEMVSIAYGSDPDRQSILSFLFQSLVEGG